MFIGHFALGFAAKRVAPRQSLATLILAPLWLDVVWPVLVLAGVERASIVPGHTAAQPLVLEHMPWSHSLVAAIVWSALYAGVIWASTRDARGTWVSAALVFSHFVLDLASHSPDMQITPWNPARYGLGLWTSLPGTLIVEGVMFAAGAWVYLTCTRARDRVGRVGPWAFLTILLVAYLGATFGPPPPSAKVVAISALVMLATLPLVRWFDARRDVI